MKVSFGKQPLIVGCIGSAALLRRCARKAPADCDMLEVRLDLTGLCDGKWMDLCAAIRKQGRPVLLTIRDEAEGGEWRGREADSDVGDEGAVMPSNIQADQVARPLPVTSATTPSRGPGPTRRRQRTPSALGTRTRRATLSHAMLRDVAHAGQSMSGRRTRSCRA